MLLYWAVHSNKLLTKRNTWTLCQSSFGLQLFKTHHMIGFSDLVDLWVIGTKKPMILCARSTSRSREQNTKRRSSSENMWKVCLFYSHNNKMVWLSNMAGTFVWKIHEVRKSMWAFFLSCLCFFGCCLSGKVNSVLAVTNGNKVNSRSGANWMKKLQV